MYLATVKINMKNGIECPPDFPDQKHKCQYFTGKDKCRAVNSWVEWLALEGGQGKTRAQLSNDYKNRSDKYYNYQYFCNAVKARGKAHELDIQKIGNPVEYYVNMDEIKPLRLYNARRRAIIKYLRKRPRNFRDYFSVETFTCQKLETVIKAIDKFYFNGTLLDDITMKIERTRNRWHLSKQPAIRYKVVDETDTTDTMWVDPYEVGDSVKEISRLDIIFNKHAWREETITRIDNVPVKTRLEALVVTSEHELTHVIVDVYKPQEDGDSQGHGEIFRLLNNRLFGHGKLKYQYDSIP